MPLTSPLRAAAPLAVAAALLLSACGSDEEDDAAGADGATTTAAAPAEYGAVKDYLAEHTALLVTETGKLREGAQQYYDLAESVDFDYPRLLSEHADEVAPI